MTEQPIPQPEPVPTDPAVAASASYIQLTQARVPLDDRNQDARRLEAARQPVAQVGGPGLAAGRQHDAHRVPGRVRPSEALAQQGQGRFR